MSTEPRSTRIVVGVDGSPESKQALRTAAELATAMKCRLEVVAAWHFPATFGLTYVPPEYNAHDLAEKALQEAVDEVFGADRPPAMAVIVREGLPSQVLLDEAENAAMLVVGSRGRGGFTGLLLGSVSSVVAQHAHCPVLTLSPVVLAKCGVAVEKQVPAEVFLAGVF